jgi:hypothetical protein
MQERANIDIRMKKESGRPQELSDIEMLKKVRKFMEGAR